jgi:ABC-2 type transport system permease protein
MSNYLSGLGVVISLELRQRVRGIAWYVLLGIFFLLVGLVTFGVWAISQLAVDAGGDANGSSMYSTIIYFVLLLGTLVAPALSGNAINGDRDAGTLATTQVTLVTTSQLLLGKFVAAWITSLAFLAVSLPFLLWSVGVGGVRLDTILVSTLVLAVELGVIAALGVGLSGLLAKPILSIVVTYLVIAMLSIGSSIAFAILGAATQTQQKVTYYSAVSSDSETFTCLSPEVSIQSTPRFDYYWGLMAMNPYVVLADASPTALTANGDPEDMFGYIKLGVRSAQIPPQDEVTYNDCATDDSGYPESPNAREVFDTTVPSWFVGFAIHIVLGALALFGAWTRLRTPARYLTKGSRIA